MACMILFPNLLPEKIDCQFAPHIVHSASQQGFLKAAMPLSLPLLLPACLLVQKTSTKPR